jgi:hypothetical protein
MRRTGLRIGIWILAGAIVTCFWVLFAMIAGPGQFDGRWTVVGVTMPASLLFRPTARVGWQSVMFLNAGIYGLVGLAIGPLLRLRYRRRQPANRRSLIPGP